jgi:hypothetical protein
VADILLLAWQIDNIALCLELGAGVVSVRKGGNITLVRGCGESQPVECVPLVGLEVGCVGCKVSETRTAANARVLKLCDTANH